MASQGVVLLACLLALFFVVTYGRNVERRQWSVGYTHAVPGKRSREAAQNDPQAFPPIRPGKRRFNSGSEDEVDNDQFPIVRQGKRQWMKNYNPMLPGKRRNEGEVDNDQLGGGLPIVRQGKRQWGWKYALPSRPGK